MRRRAAVKPKVVLLCVIFLAAALSGCGSKPADYDVQEVRCVYNYGDMDKAELDVFTPDGTVTRYVVAPYSDSGINLFEGQIPTDEQCRRKDLTISPDEWNTIVEALKSSDFMNLPEDLPKVEAYDGSTWYIEVDTSIGKHRSGGYCAGNGSGKEHERFYSVKSVLFDLLRK